MRRQLAAAAAALLVLVLPAGCSRSVDVPLEPAPLQDAWAGCRTVRPYVSDTEQNQRIDGGAPPSGFAPTELIRCSSSPSPEGDAGRLSAVEERTDQLTEVLPALALPAKRARGDVTCALILHDRPWLFLVDANRRWITVAVPQDECGAPRQEFRSAYERLEFRTTRVT